ncbi:MAG: AAA family ATPase [Candidatus Saccharimonadales bacterium]
MFIRELSISNFKGFKGTHVLKFDKNLAFFVGENNSGKSTIFEAIDFLKSGVPKNKKINNLQNKNTDKPITVEALIQEDISDVVADFSEKKYLPYIYEIDGVETIRAKRTSEEGIVLQGKREIPITVKKITLWNPKTSQFENPTGIDSAFGSLIETQFIWADTNPDDITDFGSTKICGRLLNAAIGDFFDTDTWLDFTKQHDATFHQGKDSLTTRTKKLAKEIESIIVDQYGKAGVSFNFELPDASSFVKSGNINLDDGTETSSKDKGTGMQRALALALVQVYADVLTKHPEDPKKTKPLFLFVDEPETFLHPRAQEKLLAALTKISEIRQVFVATHSPYLLKKFDPKNHMLYLCEQSANSNNAKASDSLNLFGASSPTWGEINYSAYGLHSVEFHNELYGFVQAKAILQSSDNESLKEFDNFLASHSIAKDLDWTHELAAGDKTYKVTLQTYIRNSIHHPENTKNTTYTSEQLKNSIQQLIKILTTVT